MKNTYWIAGKSIEINSLHSLVHEQCREYHAECVPDIRVEILPEDIAFERRKSLAAEGRTVSHFQDAYLETLAVYRKIAERMPEYDTVLFHGSAVAADGLA